MMRREVAEDPVAVAGRTVIPVVEISVYHSFGSGGIAVLAWKRPTAIIVISEKGKKAIRTSGEEISLDELAQQVEGMQEVLLRARS